MEIIIKRIYNKQKSGKVRVHQMIDRLFAERLIDKLSQFTEYIINIMDEDGIIIASRMKERIGTFHEVAFQLMKGDEDSRVVTKEDSEKGVRCGVNMRCV